jgi:hypothetical protein
MLRCSSHFLSLLAVASCVAAHAAELGEARVSSHIGQPLVADIELATIDDPAALVSVRLASSEVYSGAGIAMPPALSSVNLSVMKRDGRQFLHVTSLRPVDADHLHLYLELADKGQRTVRLATLWLTADPNPAPVISTAPSVAAHAEPAAVAAPGPLQARKPVAVPTLAPVPVPSPAAAVVRKAEPPSRPAEEEGAKQPAPIALRQRIKPAAETAHDAPKAAVLPPLPIHAQQPAPAACAHQAEQAKVCAALDGKNAALKERIGALEGKVKSLQATLRAPAAAIPAAPVAPATVAAVSTAASASASAQAEAAHEPPGPKPISAIKPLVPRKPMTPPPEPETGLPWGWIGGATALLLALGGAVLLLRRRARTVRKVDIPAGPRLVDRLRDQFPARSRAAPDPVGVAVDEAIEPSFE